MTTVPNLNEMFPGVDVDHIRQMVVQLLDIGQSSGHLSLQEMDQIISKLPRLTEKQVIESGHEESVCPICFVSLLALLSEEETANAMDSPAHPIEELGVTRLAEPYQCNHIYCRRDITRWIRDGHDTCPTCRRPLLERSGDSNRTDTGVTSPEDAYTPTQLEDILQHIQTISIDNQDPPEGFQIPSMTSNFPAFLFGTGMPGTARRRSDDEENGRSEYNAMYS